MVSILKKVILKGFNENITFLNCRFSQILGASGIHHFGITIIFFMCCRSHLLQGSFLLVSRVIGLEGLQDIYYFHSVYPTLHLCFSFLALFYVFLTHKNNFPLCCTSLHTPVLPFKENTRVSLCHFQSLPEVTYARCSNTDMYSPSHFLTASSQQTQMVFLHPEPVIHCLLLASSLSQLYKSKKFCSVAVSKKG